MATYAIFGCDEPLVQICLEPAVYPSQTIFGISEFLSAVAILLLVISVSDFRYRFRLQLAPLGGQRGALIVTSVIAVLIAIAEFWFGRGWPVPSFANDLPAIQAVLGVIFMFNTLFFAWSVFVIPPRFSASNAHKFAGVVYYYIGAGDQARLDVIASELLRSIASILDIAARQTSSSGERSPEAAASDLVMLLGDRRFCRALVSSGAWTIEEIFAHLAEMRSVRGIPLSHLAANLGAELITSENSPLPWEGRNVGARGYFEQVQPVSKAVFGNSALVERISDPFGPLDLWADLRRDLTPHHYENYSFAAQIFAADYFTKDRSGRRSGYVLFRTIDLLERSTSDLYQLDGAEQSVRDTPQVQKLQVAVDYAKALMDLMNESDVKVRHPSDKDSLHNVIAEMIVEIILNSTAIGSPQNTAWSVHYSMIWRPLWSFKDSPTHRAVLRCVMRKIYDEVTALVERPNYKGAKLLGYALSIFGLADKRYHRESAHPLKAACIAWSRRNFAKLMSEYPDVANAVLIGSISYDAGSNELVKTYAKGLSREAPQERLKLMV